MVFALSLLRSSRATRERADIRICIRDSYRGISKNMPICPDFRPKIRIPFPDVPIFDQKYEYHFPDVPIFDQKYE